MVQHSNETFLAVLLHGTAYCAVEVKGVLTFWSVDEIL